MLGNRLVNSQGFSTNAEHKRKLKAIKKHIVKEVLTVPHYITFIININTKFPVILIAQYPLYKPEGFNV